MIGFRVSPKFKEFLQRLAAEENRSLSSFMLNAILTYIREYKGISWQIDKDSPK